MNSCVSQSWQFGVYNYLWLCNTMNSAISMSCLHSLGQSEKGILLRLSATSSTIISWLALKTVHWQASLYELSPLCMSLALHISKSFSKKPRKCASIFK